MISLRTAEGLNLTKFSVKEGDILLAESRKYLDKGLLKVENNFLRLTKEGKLLADGIAADLFFD